MEKVGCSRLTAVFDGHLREPFITLCLSFLLYSPVGYIENQNAIDSQIVLLSGEGRGAPWGVEGGYYPIAIMPLLLAAPGNISLSGTRMGSHFSKDYLPFF